MKPLAALAPLAMLALLAAAFAAPSAAQDALGSAEAEGRSVAQSAQENAHRHVYDEGGIVVIEEDDGGRGVGALVDGASVITATEKQKAQFAMLLQAAVVTPGVPMRWNLPDLNVARVETLDEYIAGLEKGHVQGTAKIRADLASRLEGHAALVLRYIHIKRAGER